MKYFLIIVLAGLLVTGCSKENKSNKAGEKMQTFVIDISQYARTLDPDFIIIPQNGAELAFLNLDPEEGTFADYLNAVDGFGIEELFYDSELAVDEERLSMLRTLQPLKKIMIADYIVNNSYYDDATQRSLDEGFICFPRMSDNYDYTEIPDTVINENDNDVLELSDAQNFLYLISTNNFSSKQQMIDALAATNFDIILIDLFFDDTPFTSSEIAQLKTKANGGKRLVISYINVGAAENYRYYWQEDWKLHHPGWLKKSYEGYEDEVWVKFWEQDWQDIIYGNEDSYIKKIIDAGFDGAYLDNVECYYFLYFD